MSTKTLLLVAAATGGYLLLNRKQAGAASSSVTYTPPRPVAPEPTRFEQQQADDTLKLAAMASAGVPLKPSTKAKVQNLVALGGSIGGAAGCVAIGAAAAAPLCAMAGGWAAGKVAPAVYGAGKATAQVALKAVKAPINIIKSPVKSAKAAVLAPVKIIKSPVKSVKSVVKAPVNVAKKLKFW